MYGTAWPAAAAPRAPQERERGAPEGLRLPPPRLPRRLALGPRTRSLRLRLLPPRLRPRKRPSHPAHHGTRLDKNYRLDLDRRDRAHHGEGDVVHGHGSRVAAELLQRRRRRPELREGDSLVDMPVDHEVGPPAQDDPLESQASELRPPRGLLGPPR